MREIVLSYLAPEIPPDDFSQYDYREEVYLKTLRESMVSRASYAPAAELTTNDVVIEGYRGPITVRHYRQAQRRIRPAVLYMHGGAWCGGDIDFTDAYCRALCDFSDAAVFSVDYHLSPEFPFPHGIEDCYETLRWMTQSADELGIDPADITLSGDSAGGNFSAGLSLMARDRGDVGVKNQILLYPGVSLRPEDGVGGDEPHARMSMNIVTGWYIGSADPHHPYIEPLSAGSLRDMPLTLIAIGELDGMRHAQRRYAERLSAEGNDVTLLYMENTLHGFVTRLGEMPQALDLARLSAEFIHSGKITSVS